MNSEMADCSSTRPSSTLPAGESNDARAPDPTPADPTDPTEPNERTERTLADLSRIAPATAFLKLADRLTGGSVPLSARTGPSLSLSPQIGRAHV